MASIKKVDQLNGLGQITQDFDEKNQDLAIIFQKALNQELFPNNHSYSFAFKSLICSVVFSSITYSGTGYPEQSKRVQINQNKLKNREIPNSLFCGVYTYRELTIFCFINKESYIDIDPNTKNTSRHFNIFDLESALKNEIFVNKDGHLFFIPCHIEIALDEYFSKNYDADFSSNSIYEETDGYEVNEGKAVTRIHKSRERDSKLIRLKKEYYKKNNRPLECEACGFNFKNIYGERGENFIECHHIKPISELSEFQKTNLDDLAILCSNCHRMIHRRKPWLSVESLKNIITNLRDI